MSSYHNEALRKQRVLERKREAIEKQKECFGLDSGEYIMQEKRETPLVHSEPGHYQQSRLTYFKIGPERDRRQFDHSRNGPVVDKSRYQLKQDFNFLGSSLSMLKADIVPEHKPMPLSSRFY